MTSAHGHLRGSMQDLPLDAYVRDMVIQTHGEYGSRPASAPLVHRDMLDDKFTGAPPPSRVPIAQQVRQAKQMFSQQRLNNIMSEIDRVLTYRLMTIHICNG